MRSYKYEKIIAGLLYVLYISAIIISAIKQDWYDLFFSAVALFLTYIPFVIIKRTKFFIPPSFQIAFLIFVFASLFLGDVTAWYWKIWWWDLILHGLSGIVMGFIGLFWILTLTRLEKTHIVLSPVFVAFFALALAMTAGTIWEILEFTLDKTIGTDAQRNSLDDTMWDIVFNFVGALIVAAIGYLYFKKGKFSYLEKVAKINKDNK
ncbi:MAG: hypothetical protein ABIE68_02940 [bacterium]